MSHEHVYLREVQAAQDDSLSRILTLIPPDSAVLDVGTGSGALGRHLTKSAGFVVDGITHNELEAVLARPHYRKLLVMDLEHQPLHEAPDLAQYDVIVCADVLEHLRNASEVLRALGTLLKPGGVVLVSMPNVTHLGVILGLMAGRFVRTREGLLDATHVRFMDRTALRALAQGAGYAVTHEDAVRRNLIDTEFAGLNFLALPAVVRSYLLSLPDAEVYQFVWALSPRTQAGDPVDVSAPDSPGPQPPAAPAMELVPRFRTQLFLDRGTGFNEPGSVEAFGVQSEGVQTLSFKIEDGAGVQALRLDFSDRPGQIEFVSLQAMDAQGNPAWAWNGDWAANQIYHQCDWTGVRGWFGGRIVRAIGDDPWVCIPLQLAQWAEVQRVELSMTSPQPAGGTDWPGLDVPQLQGMLATMSSQLHALSDRDAERIATLGAQLNRAQELADCRLTEGDTLTRERDTLKIENETLRQELAASREVAASRIDLINVMQASSSWRLTAGLRWLIRLMRRGVRP